MMEPKSKNSKVAYRLAEILTRLNSGERLNIKGLSEDFETHPRTILRDLEERMAYLPIQKEGKSYFLDGNYLGRLSFKDIQNFAQISGISYLYPNLDMAFLRELLDQRVQGVFSAKGYFFEDTKYFELAMVTIKSAIKEQREVSFLYKDQPRLVQPYQIIHQRGCWYLAAVRQGQLKSYRFSRMKQVEYSSNNTRFIPEEAILEQLRVEESIWFGVDKTEVLLTINAEVANHFKQKQLIPEQKVIKELDDGTLLLSSTITHPKQLLPLIRYWIPYVKVINPPTLQESLEAELRAYLGM